MVNVKDRTKQLSRLGIDIQSEIGNNLPQRGLHMIGEFRDGTEYVVKRREVPEIDNIVGRKILKIEGISMPDSSIVGQEHIIYDDRRGMTHSFVLPSSEYLKDDSPLHDFLDRNVDLNVLHGLRISRAFESKGIKTNRDLVNYIDKDPRFSDMNGAGSGWKIYRHLESFGFKLFPDAENHPKIDEPFDYQSIDKPKMRRKLREGNNQNYRDVINGLREHDGDISGYYCGKLGYKQLYDHLRSIGFKIT